MAFGTFEVHAGDFKKGSDHQYLTGKPGNFIMKTAGKFFRETIPITEIVELDAASEESVKRIGGTVGWGAVGGVLLGPVGLLAGLLVGGRGKDVTFVCKLKDGRKFMATVPSKVYTELSAVLLNDTKKCPRCAEYVKQEATACRFCNLKFPKSYSAKNISHAAKIIVPAGSWKCTKCGEVHGKEFDACWNCESSRVG
ncbi:MAG: hypothetical protein ABL933_17180 [Methyloglobulus sp.]